MIQIYFFLNRKARSNNQDFKRKSKTKYPKKKTYVNDLQKKKKKSNKQLLFSYYINYKGYKTVPFLAEDIFQEGTVL